MKLSEVTKMVGGELSGDPDGEVHGAAGIREVQEGEITFLADRKLLQECAGSRASCVLVTEFFTEIRKPQIRVKNPQYAFAQLLKHFSVPAATPSGISDLAFVSERASLGRDVSVHPFAFISDGAVVGEKTVVYPGVFIGNDVSIGSECIIYPNVTIRERVKIGNRVIIHSGSVIGADGFGYVFEGGRHFKIPQVGTVVIGDDVEIGANVTIDRATTGVTVIGRGTKIDNLVQIGHNVSVGENSILVAQVGIAGSTEIGNFVMLGGQVGVADHAKIDDGTMIGAQSGIMGGHLTKGVYLGSPVLPHREYLRAAALFARLPELNKRIKELEEKLNHLEGRQKC